MSPLRVFIFFQFLIAQICCVNASHNNLNVVVDGDEGDHLTPPPQQIVGSPPAVVPQLNQFAVVPLVIPQSPAGVVAPPPTLEAGGFAVMSPTLGQLNAIAGSPIGSEMPQEIDPYAELRNQLAEFDIFDVTQKDLENYQAEDELGKKFIVECLQEEVEYNDEMILLYKRDAFEGKREFIVSLVRAGCRDNLESFLEKLINLDKEDETEEKSAEWLSAFFILSTVGYQGLSVDQVDSYLSCEEDGQEIIQEMGEKGATTFYPEVLKAYAEEEDEDRQFILAQLANYELEQGFDEVIGLYQEERVDSFRLSVVCQLAGLIYGPTQAEDLDFSFEWRRAISALFLVGYEGQLTAILVRLVHQIQSLNLMVTQERISDGLSLLDQGYPLSSLQFEGTEEDSLIFTPAETPTNILTFSLEN